MAAPVPVGTALAWRWVIEALADAKQVEASTLAELIGRNPDVLKDSGVNERISLRYLEELLGSDRGKSAAAGGAGDSSSMSVDLPVTEGSTGAIDVASRSEDVLCGYLQKLETLCKRSNHGKVMYKNELRRFVLHKRAALPKSFLELLEASIDKTSNESASFSMRNHDLTQGIQVDQLHVNDVSKVAEMLLELANCCDKIATSSVLVCSDVRSENVLPGHRHHCAEVDGLGECQRNPVYTDKNTMLHHGSNTKGSQDGVPNGVKEYLHSSSDQITSSSQEGGEEMLRDEDETHVATPVCDLFIEIIASEKRKLVNSQNPNNHDSSIGNGTQQQLCIKCDEAGQLLLCSASGCPIAVHERCLGFAVSFQDTGEFYCPFCSYMQAATAYCNARTKVSVCRKNLSSFMDWDPIHQKSVVQPATLKEPSNQLKDAKECYHVKDAEQKRARESVDGIRENIYRKVKESILFHENNASTPIVNELETILQREIPKCQNQKGTDNPLISNTNIMICDGIVKSSVDNHDGQCKQVLEKQQFRELASIMKSGCLPCHESDASQMREHANCSPKHIEELEYQLQSKGHERCKHDSPSKETFGSSVEKEAKSMELDPQISGQENRSSSKQCRKPLKRQKRYANPVYPFSRRNRLPWTAEEEEILKEAVWKFSDSASGILPWTQILEYGRHVFHKTRQPADLKDKWRNIRIKEDKT